MHRMLCRSIGAYRVLIPFERYEANRTIDGRIRRFDVCKVVFAPVRLPRNRLVRMMSLSRNGL